MSVGTFSKTLSERALWPREAVPGLYLVGDSVLLGQSTLAVALGGVRTAEKIAMHGA